MTKHEKLTQAILIEGKRISSEKVDDTTIKGFIEERLKLHGRNGYMFHVSINYQKQLWQTTRLEYNMIACYVANRNHLRIDDIKLTQNECYVYQKYIERTV